MSNANYTVQVETLSTILALIHGSYSSDHVGTSFELLSYSPFPFHGMKA